MKTILILLVGVVLGWFASMSFAQTTVYTDRNGAVIGYGTRNGNVITYTDSIGRVQGYETRKGNTSTFTNSIGAVEGYRTGPSTPSRSYDTPWGRGGDKTDRYGMDPAVRGGWKDD